MTDPAPLRTPKEMGDLLERLNRRMLEEQAPLQGGGGGGTSDGMEPRVAKLEALMEGVRSDITDIKGAQRQASADLATVREGLAGLTDRVKGLPDKDYIGSTFRNWFIFGGAMIAGVNIIVSLILKATGAN